MLSSKRKLVSRFDSTETTPVRIWLDDDVPMDIDTDEDDEKKYDGQGDIIPPPNGNAIRPHMPMPVIGFNPDDDDEHMNKKKKGGWKIGPLWPNPQQQGKKGYAIKRELWVYDTFCMVFLNRQGHYYKIEQDTWLKYHKQRTSYDLMHYLKSYYKLLRNNRPKDTWMNHEELRNWWEMNPPTIELYTSGNHPMNISHGPLTRTLTSNKQTEETEFYKDMLYYTSLLLSDRVELRICPGHESNPLNWGVFAKQTLEDGQKLPELKNKLIKITPAQYQLLKEKGQDHSVFEFKQRDIKSLDPPPAPINNPGYLSEAAKRIRDRNIAKSKPPLRPKKSSTSMVDPNTTLYYIVTGGISFINNACWRHHNANHCIFTSDKVIGNHQWQVITPIKRIPAGTEIYVSYEGDREPSGAYYCTGCDLEKKQRQRTSKAR